MGDASGSGIPFAIDASGKVHAAGTTIGVLQTTPNAFISAVQPEPPNVEYTYPFAEVLDFSQDGGTVCLDSASARGLAFAAQPPDTTALLPVTISNCGNASITIQSVTGSDPAFSVPSQQNNCTAALPAAYTCTLQVGFTPAADQSYTASLTIKSSASASSVSIPLMGIGAGSAPFTLGVANGGSSSASVNSGAAATYSLAITGSGSFTGTVNLTCSGAPLYAVCSISPAALSVAGTTANSVTVTITTGSQSGAVQGRGSTLAVLGMGLMGVGTLARRRRRWWSTLLSLCGVLMLVPFSACGGGGGGGGGGTTTTGLYTAPGTYGLTVTAVSGTTKETQALTLVVK